jgi:hypothetical protein
MSSPADRTGRPAAAPRPSLSGTVLRLATVALVAAALVWSVLFADALRTRRDTAAALAQPAGRLAGPDDGGSAQAPAPVTTRTS